MTMSFNNMSGGHGICRSHAISGHKPARRQERQGHSAARNTALAAQTPLIGCRVNGVRSDGNAVAERWRRTQWNPPRLATTQAA